MSLGKQCPCEWWCEYYPDLSPVRICRLCIQAWLPPQEHERQLARTGRHIRAFWFEFSLHFCLIIEQTDCCTAPGHWFSSVCTLQGITYLQTQLDMAPSSTTSCFARSLSWNLCTRTRTSNSRRMLRVTMSKTIKPYLWYRCKPPNCFRWADTHKPISSYVRMRKHCKGFMMYGGGGWVVSV